ncbi:MAG: hypothetical protein U0R77_13790 [Mycolicibacterium insubricum]|nr:hypothetical protein [Mycobacterium sp.]
MYPENLEARVTSLETQVRNLTVQVRATKADAAAARVLAGAADRDVEEIRGELRDFRRATTRSFNALRQDMVDGFKRVDENFKRIDENFTRVDENFTRVDENFSLINESFRLIDEKFALVDNGFAEMRSKFDMTAAGQQHIADLIQTVIDTQRDEGRDGPA